MVKVLGLKSEVTSRSDRMIRAPTSRSRKSGNPKIVGSSPEPAGLYPGRVKPMTLKLILITF